MAIVYNPVGARCVSLTFGTACSYAVFVILEFRCSCHDKNYISSCPLIRSTCHSNSFFTWGDVAQWFVRWTAEREVRCSNLSKQQKVFFTSREYLANVRE